MVAAWAAALLDGPHAGVYAEPLLPIADSLSRAFRAQPQPFFERDRALGALIRAASRQPAIAAQFLDLYRSVLTAAYRRVLARLDLQKWAAEQATRLAEPDKVAAHFAFLDANRIRGLIDRIESAPEAGLLSSSFPLFSNIADETIEQAFRLDTLGDRFAVCLRLLEDDTLGYRRNRIAADLPGVAKEMLRAGGAQAAEVLLDALAAFFEEREGEYLSMRFQCYEAIGVAVGQAGDVVAAERLVSDLVRQRFQYPEARGVTDEWATIVNPFHLQHVRCWMRIVESNPALYERLAAALDMHLRLGGVHIADTDLFQRDISRLLAADIRPVYFVAKQLLRTMPVYFNEVGAEGELRAVTTEVDELSGRRDTLIHSLRKQSHTESSNRLVALSRAVLRYWATLDPAGLEPYVSAVTLDEVRNEPRWAEGPHAALLRAGAPGAGDPARVEDFLDRLVALPPEQVFELFDSKDGAGCQLPRAEDCRRVALVLRTHQLLARKYSVSDDGVGEAVARHFQIDGGLRSRFESALAAWQHAASPDSRDALLDAALEVLEALKEIILGGAPSVPSENLYRKRHIAAGIPSIYGSYNENRFDSLGLSLRIERLVARLLDDVADEGLEPYLTRGSLRRMARSLRRFQRALAVDGISSVALAANLDVLEASFAIRNFKFSQYRDVLQFIGTSVAEMTAASVQCHEQALQAILASDPRPLEARGLDANAVSEVMLREVLVSALGLQALDRYVAAALRQVSLLNERLSSHALTRMMNYDPEALVSFIHEPMRSSDDPTTLGLKGLGLKQMASWGYKVPEGFILTTELFDARPAMASQPLLEDVERRIREALGRLEADTGLRLGDPGRPLLLSIRSGAAVSMPGLMTTFVNVGLDEGLAEAMSRRPGFEWAAWDCYRRFVQSWSMACGLDRDFFDSIMKEFKKRRGVERKIDFDPAGMREIALAYKERAREAGIVFEDDPFRQVIACVFKVLDSWDAPHAGLYREYMGIAEEWGTAVIVQRMVFGNLGRSAGSGVVFTCDPLGPRSCRVRLFGDFAVQCQGEDLVGGLVFPLPVSEAQRRGSQRYRATSSSLEKDFPAVYEKLFSVARDLVSVREFSPLEIEFTFESPAADDLYILQKRPMVHELARELPCIDTLSPDVGDPVAFGTGVAGGAYSGRAAVNPEQIDFLLKEYPGENILLLRPDTVPEDIGMIARVSGLLTARGGATSHAAVTARRLGKTAVVGCVDLEVSERRGSARLAGIEVRPGDWLTIDGRTGNIFVGRMPVVSEKALVGKVLRKQQRKPRKPAGPPATAPGTGVNAAGDAQSLPRDAAPSGRKETT